MKTKIVSTLLIGTVASGSGKVEAINTDADRRLLHDQRLREVKKANRLVAIPQSQDNDNDNKQGDDTAAKVVETKTIGQEHVEPDFGVLLTEHERDLKAKSGKSIKSFKSKSGKSLSKNSRDPPVVTTTKATNPVTSTPEPPVATPVTTTKATNPVTSTPASPVTTTKATNPVTTTQAPPVTTPVTTSQATSTTPACVKFDDPFDGIYGGRCTDNDDCCPYASGTGPGSVSCSEQDGSCSCNQGSFPFNPAPNDGCCVSSSNCESTFCNLKTNRCEEPLVK